jgi:hypothetical protein
MDTEWAVVVVVGGDLLNTVINFRISLKVMKFFTQQAAPGF